MGRVTPKKFIRILWEKGLIDSHGKVLECEVYSTRDKSPELIFAEINRIEMKYSWVFWLSKMHYFFLRLLKPSLVLRRPL